MGATLTSDTLQYEAVSVRAAVFGHKDCEQIAVHMLLIELCRAPIAHCLRSQTEFPCLPFILYCHQAAQLISPTQEKNKTKKPAENAGNLTRLYHFRMISWYCETRPLAFHLVISSL